MDDPRNAIASLQGYDNFNLRSASYVGLSHPKY